MTKSDEKTMAGLVWQLQQLTYKLLGTGTSLDHIATLIPETNVSPGALCPELVVKALGASVFSLGDEAHEITTQMDDILGNGLSADGKGGESPPPITKSEISMDAVRGTKFRNAIWELTEANQSLRTIFKGIKVTEYLDVHPNLLIEAMTEVIDRRLSLVLAMANNEEHLDEIGEVKK